MQETYSGKIPRASPNIKAVYAYITHKTILKFLGTGPPTFDEIQSCKIAFFSPAYLKKLRIPFFIAS